MDIKDWRNQIDELNDEIIALLNKRASCAVEIGKIKKAKGLPVFDSVREQAVLDCISQKAGAANGPLSPDSFKRIFQTIMEETRKVEK